MTDRSPQRCCELSTSCRIFLLAMSWCVPWSIAAAPAMAEGLLSSIREDVRAPRSDDDDDDDDHSRRRRHRSDHDCNCDDDDDDSIFGELFGQLALHALTSPFWAPPGALKDDYQFEGFFPRFATSLAMDPTRTNSADILIDWVYEPDARLWGPACREFGQTFVAASKELVSITLLVASFQTSQ